MAEAQDGIGSSSRAKPRGPSFLSCFGYSGKKHDKYITSQVLDDDLDKIHDDDDGKVKPAGERKLTRWVSLPRLRIKKTSACRTVPVDATAVSEKAANRSREIHVVKVEKKASSKSQAPATGVKPSQTPAAAPDQAANERSHRLRHGNANSIILENSENLDHSRRKDAFQKGSSSGRKNGLKRPCGTRPGSPQENPCASDQNQNGVVLSHSLSFPPPTQKKQAANSSEKSTKRRRGRESAIGQIDPVVGMSIIMTTLIIMLLWGKVCAIICTSAWFYFVPRLRTAVETKPTSTSQDLHLDSEEYKKKVVLEGFLDRNRRNAAGIS